MHVCGTRENRNRETEQMSPTVVQILTVKIGLLCNHNPFMIFIDQWLYRCHLFVAFCFMCVLLVVSLVLSCGC